MVDANTSYYKVGSIRGLSEKEVTVANSKWMDKGIYLHIDGAAHLPFEVAEEIALDILARLKDRGFYDREETND